MPHKRDEFASSGLFFSGSGTSVTNQKRDDPSPALVNRWFQHRPKQIRAPPSIRRFQCRKKWIGLGEWIVFAAGALLTSSIVGMRDFPRDIEQAPLVWIDSDLAS
jgi:hypothetical protein